MKAKINSDESGQALVELSFGLIMLCVFVFGIIDFGRGIYDVQVIEEPRRRGFQHGFPRNSSGGHRLSRDRRRRKRHTHQH